MKLVVAEDAEAHRQHWAQVEILLTFLGTEVTPEFLNQAPNLRWVQAFVAGVDRLPLAELKNRGIILTNVSGTHGQSMSEQAFTYMLAFSRLLPRFLLAQRRHDWDRPSGLFAFEPLSGKTLTVVGAGRIGQEVARLGQAMRMRTIAVNTSGKLPPHFHLVYPREQLTTALAEADFVVLLVPHTPDTVGLIGEAELASLKPTAYLINLARGSVVDEPALIAALRKQKLAGAALDVFAVEPLPADSPLWDLPNVIITPHIGGWSADYLDRCLEVFADNLERYLTGQTMATLVDLDRGY